MDRYPGNQPSSHANGTGGGTAWGENWSGTCVTGNPAPPPYGYPGNQQGTNWVPVEYVPYGTVPNSSHAFSANGAGGGSSYARSNPYIQVEPATGSSGTTDTWFKLLGRCGKTLEVTTRKAGSVAGNVWQHLKTSPNPTDAAIARLTQGTKVFAEGGHDKIFLQSFGTVPGERLLKAFACYISTSSDPLIGTLYLSTARLAFCSDNPLYHSPSPQQSELKYYKVVVQLDLLGAVNPSANRVNPSEKSIQIITVDGHEFWFMGFVSYDKVLKNLTEVLQQHSILHH